MSSIRNVLFDIEPPKLYFLGISTLLKDIVLISKMNSILDEPFFFASNFSVLIDKKEAHFTMFKSSHFEEKEQRALIICASNENANLIKGLKGIDFLLVANFPLKKWKQKLSEHTFIQLLLEIEEKSMKPHIPSLNKIFEV